MMQDYVIPALVGIVSALGSGFASYIFTRSKYKAEVHAQNISNRNEELEYFKNVCREMRAELEEAAKKRDYMSELIDKLWGENQELKFINYQLQLTVMDQQRRLENLEALLNTLPQEKHGKRKQKNTQAAKD